jgi:hypothetical protein
MDLGSFEIIDCYSTQNRIGSYQKNMDQDDYPNCSFVKMVIVVVSERYHDLFMNLYSYEISSCFDLFVVLIAKTSVFSFFHSALHSLSLTSLLLEPIYCIKVPFSLWWSIRINFLLVFK